ncbi:MAG: deoxyribonuclease IV [Chitinispirillaceae bacterium]|jgi:deoxyribonuclease-4|nr:deoxyribonuclease IV [Chitinispirillaceae bacterium]
MKYIGPHVSISGGVQNAPLNAAALGATAFGLFTKNQRQWVAAHPSLETIADFKNNLKKTGYSQKTILAHDSYLINLGNPDPAAYAKSLNAFIDELQRCAALGITRLNMHPGSHLKLVSEEVCLRQIANAINRAHDATAGVTVVLENTAGQGSNVGYSFEHLAFIIKLVSDKSRIGFCLDTCHAFAAGHDLLTRNAYDATMANINKIIGFEYLRGAHLNDAKAPLGSRLDRHQSIGRGTLGLEPFGMIMRDDRFNDLPLILETIDESLWADEIAMLKGMM